MQQFTTAAATITSSFSFSLFLSFLRTEWLCDKGDGGTTGCIVGGDAVVDAVVDNRMGQTTRLPHHNLD